jgi:NADPH2:quinone reductase
MSDSDDVSPQQESGEVRNRRVVATRRGGPDILRVIEDRLPEPKHGEVRVRILATGVSFADLLMREGVHPETPHGPITLGWDLVGVIDKLGAGVSGVTKGDTIAALPVMGGYADYICLRPDQLVAVPAGLDPAEAVAMVLNYMTAYQMLHRSARVQPGQCVLIHAAGGGIGTALLQLGRRVDLTMYGTASRHAHETVTNLGGIPIDYKHVDFVKEIRRLTNDGVDAVFDGVGGAHVWQSFKALRPGGTVVAYGLTSSLRSGRLTGGPRHRFRGLSRIGLYKLATACLPGRRRIRIYSIQRRMWRHPDWFREDLTALFELVGDGKIKPIIAARMPLAEARRAHELLAHGSVTGKIVLLCGEQNDKCP